MYAIETRELTRSYKTYEKQAGIMGSLKGFWSRQYQEKLALATTTLQIEQGQIVGLVGANGAGKTTLLKILSGLVHPSSGQAKVLGYTPWERKPEFLKQMSILLGQKNQLWWDISPNDSYSLLIDIYELEEKAAKNRVEELARILNCEQMLKTQLRRLSLGERMKMEIIGALLHQPKILFLDEPTIGLDIVAQTKIRTFLSEYAKNQGPTIILTSHYMDDIAQLSDRLLLLSKGHMVYDGSVEQFTKKTQVRQKIIFSLQNPLTENFEIKNLKSPLILNSGTQEFSLEINKSDVPIVLSQISALKGVLDIKLDQVDFEEVIHQFMQGQQ
jgi:ABC-2 type transport system ATP-binding protein